MSGSNHPVCFVCGADRSGNSPRCPKCNASTVVNVARSRTRQNAAGKAEGQTADVGRMAADTGLQRLAGAVPGQNRAHVRNSDPETAAKAVSGSWNLPVVARFGSDGIVTAATHRLPRELAADGWYHLMPFGEHPGVAEHPDGRLEDCIHVFTEAAFRELLGNFGRLRELNLKNDPAWRGLDVDADHLSHYDTGSSARYGFLTDLKIVGDGSDRAHGLYCKIDWTPLGKDAIEGQVYSFLSAVTRNKQIGPGRYAPGLLTDACVTNQPQLPVRSMNRAPSGDFVMARCRVVPPSAPGHGDQGGKQEPPAPAGTQEKTDMDFKAMLLRLLGLAETATDQEIQTAIDAMGAETMDKVTAKCRDLEKKNRELSLGVEADKFCDDNKAIIKDRAAVRSRFLADPEGTKLTFSGLHIVPKEEAPRSFNRATVPAGATIKPGTDAGAIQSQQTALVNQIAKRDGCSKPVAFNRARQEKPELFPVLNLKQAE